MKYCYIFDYSAGTINCLHLNDETFQPEDDEELIARYGFKPSQCSWMFSDDELEINHIYSPIK